jgi:parallel beta-helix repeat protein
VKKSACALVLLLFLSFVLFSLPQIGVVKAESTIYIRADGSVEGTDKIQRDGNAYTFTDDIFDHIIVDRNNIVIDGAGYILQGNGSGVGILGITGISLDYRSNVTIKNIQIKNFYFGIWLRDSSNNIISGNNITNNYGITIYDSSGNTFFHNNLINNQNQIYLWEASTTWDDGYPSGGNYWSDYTGVDEYSGVNQDEPGSDGIGDTPYIIDANNKDNYPLMEYFIIPEFPSWPILPLFMIATLAVIFYGKRFRAHLKHF